MKIVVAGMGMVGYDLCKNLSQDGHNITCIDNNIDTLAVANEAMDVMCVSGNCTSIRTLKEAGICDTDVFIAVCRQDEINMLGCLMAKRLGAKYTVARIREPQFEAEVDLIQNEIGIDLVINPEQTTAMQLLRLLRFPNASNIETFYSGKVELIGFKVLGSDFIAGRSLAESQKKLSNCRVLFCTVERADGTAFIPNGSDIINEGDTAYIIGDILSINEFFKILGRISKKVKNVILVGGGRTTEYLADLLCKMKKSVKILEIDRDRCEYLSETLPKALILNGNGMDKEVLITENFASSDSFASLTGDDEDNLISALYAKRAGVPQVIAKVNRRDYYDLVAPLGIDSIVNPKLATAFMILRYIRAMSLKSGSRMQALYSIAGGKAEAAEFAVTEKTKNINLPLKNLGAKIKKGVLIVAILRDGNVIIPDGNAYYAAGDNIIVASEAGKICDIDDMFIY